MQKFLDSLISPEKALKAVNTVKHNALAVMAAVFALTFVAAPEVAIAGTNAMFDDVATQTDSAVFGPLGQAVIYIGALGGGIFAVMKGAWLFAGLGVGIAGLMFLSQTVANASTFSALLPMAGL